MNTKELLKARFAVVRRDLDRVLSRLTDELLTWAPREGMRTVQGQLFEIVGKEVELLTFAKAGGHDEWVEVENFGGREATLEGMKGVLKEARRGNPRLSRFALGQRPGSPRSISHGLVGRAWTARAAVA